MKLLLHLKIYSKNITKGSVKQSISQNFMKPGIFQAHQKILFKQHGTQTDTSGIHSNYFKQTYNIKTGTQTQQS